MWLHIKKLNGGSWWMREGSLPNPIPPDWTIIEIKSAPSEWWQSWGE